MYSFLVTIFTLCTVAIWNPTENPTAYRMGPDENLIINVHSRLQSRADTTSPPIGQPSVLEEKKGANGREKIAFSSLPTALPPHVF